MDKTPITTTIPTSLYLFAFFFAIYLLTMSGFGSSDVGQLRAEVARSIVERFDVAVPPGFGISGIDGRDYSWFGIGSVILALPLFVVGKVTAVDPATMLMLLYPFFGACTAVLLFLFSIALGYSHKTSLSVSFIYGLGSIAWLYSKDTGDHGFEVFFVLLSFYGAYRYAINKNFYFLCLVGFSAGFAFLIRPTSMLILPPLYILLTFYNIRDDNIKKILRMSFFNATAMLIMLLPFITLFCLYNYLRFGSALETGYGLMATRWGVNYFKDTPFLTGLLGFLASPWKGFFFYSPVALLFLFSIKAFLKRHRIVAISFFILTACYILFYSKYLYWHGCNGWGPRFIFVITPFLILPIAEIIDSGSWHDNKYMRLFCYALCGLSFFIQCAAISVNSDYLIDYLQHHEKTKFVVSTGIGVPSIKSPQADIFFDWDNSPIIWQFVFSFDFFNNVIFYDNIDLRQEVQQYPQRLLDLRMKVYDFWWLYIYVFTGSYAGISMALILAIFAFYCGLMLCKQNYRQD